MCTLALSHELHCTGMTLVMKELFYVCFLASRVAQLVTLMPKGHDFSLVTAEVHYLLLFRKFHFTYLADLKDDAISGLSKPNYTLCGLKAKK